MAWPWQVVGSSELEIVNGTIDGVTRISVGQADYEPSPVMLVAGAVVIIAVLVIWNRW